MKLFDRTGGHWLFWCGAVYLLLAFTVNTEYAILLQVLWLSVLALPLTYNPLARWLNMKETHMFDFFKKKPSNVVPFPEIPKTEVKNPYIPPEPEKPAHTFYRLGLTSNGRVSFQMGYSEITMNAGGIDNMIKQLELFREQVLQYEENNGDEQE